jgi:hypothetical protein
MRRIKGSAAAEAGARADRRGGVELHLGLPSGLMSTGCFARGVPALGSGRHSGRALPVRYVHRGHRPSGASRRARHIGHQRLEPGADRIPAQPALAFERGEMPASP